MPTIWRPCTVGIIALLLATACGSTVELPSGQTGASSPGSGSRDDQFSLATVPTEKDAEVLPPAARPGVQVSQGNTDPHADGNGAAAEGQPQGHGTDSAEAPSGNIKIGFVTTDLSGFGGRLGDDSFQGVQDGNREAERREFAALVEYANEHGGVGGREIQAIEFPVSAAELNAAYTERLCVAAATDHGVLAMIDRTYLNFEQTVQCFAKHGVTLIGIQPTIVDSAFLARVRPFSAGSYPALDRIGRGMVEGLQSAGWFDGVTVGVIMDDSPSMRRVFEQHIAPAMAALGVQANEVVYVTAESTEPSTVELANAVLRFRSRGVTNVFNLLSLVNFVAFQNQAESQGYRPRYGFGDYVGGVRAAVGYGLPSQNSRSVAVSVDPRSVVTSPDSPGWDGPTRGRPGETPETVTPGTRRCIEILSEYTGQNYYLSPAQTGASISYRWHCDHFLLWLEAARRVGPHVNPATWGRGLAALADEYEPTTAFRTRFSSDRFDGASAYAVGEYASSCECFIRQGIWREFR